MAKERRKSESVEVDFDGVESGRKILPEGTYEVTVNEAKKGKSKNDQPKVSFEFEVTEGKFKGNKLFEECSLQKQALFKLKNVLTALGLEIPNKAFDLNLKELIGLTCFVEVGHEVYEGKKKNRILEYINPEDSEGEEDDEEDDDEDLEDRLKEMDLEELQDLAKELDISKSDIKKCKKAKALVELIIDTCDVADIKEALGDEEDDEEEDDKADYSEMSLSELKAECKDRGLKVKKGMDKDDLIEMLEEDDEE